VTREQADLLLDAFDAANVEAHVSRRARGDDPNYSVGILNFPSQRAFIAALDAAGVEDARYSAGTGWHFTFAERPE
jgi:hypothetical protein